MHGQPAPSALNALVAQVGGRLVPLVLVVLVLVALLLVVLVLVVGVGLDHFGDRTPGG